MVLQNKVRNKEANDVKTAETVVTVLQYYSASNTTLLKNQCAQHICMQRHLIFLEPLSKAKEIGFQEPKGKTKPATSWNNRQPAREFFGCIQQLTLK